MHSFVTENDSSQHAVHNSKQQKLKKMSSLYLGLQFLVQPNTEIIFYHQCSCGWLLFHSISRNVFTEMKRLKYSQIVQVSWHLPYAFSNALFRCIADNINWGRNALESKSHSREIKNERPNNAQLHPASSRPKCWLGAKHCTASTTNKTANLTK